MSSTIKNIIILIVVAVALGAAYFYFLKPAPEQPTLTSAPAVPSSVDTTSGTSSVSGSEFLTVLLNVKNIKLDDSIFSDPAFATLHDSSIELVNDGTEGRPNPFAPIGSDITAAPINAIIPAPVVAPQTITPPSSNTPKP